MCVYQQSLSPLHPLPISAIVFGFLIIGLAFLLHVVPAGVLQIVFSIFGAIGGPILTVFTLGMVCPFVNEWVSSLPPT